MTDKYLNIVRHYESCFKNYGDTAKGVDWPNLEDLLKRYEVMSGIVEDNADFSLLDFGCGNGMFIPFLEEKFKGKKIEYYGHDISKVYVDHCRNKFPNYIFTCGDVLTNFKFDRTFDFIVMNGVFTEKRDLSFLEMLAYFKKLLTVIFDYAKIGVAFNVMSSHVDWEREDLFHLPLDVLAEFLVKDLTRSFVIKNDYGLYEYTVYIYKK